MHLSERHREYWRRNLLVTAILLLLWFFVTFGTIHFAEALNRVSFLGFPLGFYMAAQGSLLVYVAIIWLYARIMDSLDRECGVAEKE